MNKQVKESDIRFTSNNVFELLKKNTGVDWKKAFDPTPKNSKINYLEKEWTSSKIFLNPPFSKSKIFVTKLIDEMYKHQSIKKALIHIYHLVFLDI